MAKQRICTNCSLLKDLSSFCNDKRGKYGKQACCKECKAEKHRVYYKSNKNRIISYIGEWKSKNREKVNISERKSYRKNRTSINSKKNIYYIKRRKEDNFFNIKSKLRIRLYHILKDKNLYKRYHFFEYIGCDRNTLINHLENQFTDGMTWDNKGKWHIDHIIPLSSAKTEEELYKLCHYTNLQPLWGIDNIKKGSK